MLLPLRALFATVFQLLQSNVLQSVLFVAVHERRATVNAATDPGAVLDAGAQQGLVGESWSLMIDRAMGGKRWSVL